MLADIAEAYEKTSLDLEGQFATYKILCVKSQRPSILPFLFSFLNLQMNLSQL